MGTGETCVISLYIVDEGGLLPEMSLFSLVANAPHIKEVLVTTTTLWRNNNRKGNLLRPRRSCS